MTFHRIRKTRNRQPQRPVGINPEFPAPVEVFLPHITRNGLLRNAIASGGACSISPTSEGVGAVFSNTAQYTFPVFDGESKVAWFVIAYRDGSATSYYSLLRKNGTLIPIQEAWGAVRCVPWPDRTDPLYTSDYSNCNNRINTFGGLIDGSNNTLHFNGNRIPFSESVPLSSGGANLCIGGSEAGDEVASPWTILAVVIWQKNIPSEQQLFELQKNLWLVFAPETIPLFFSTTGGATNLSIADASHGHAIDNLTFSLDTYLAAQDSTHAHTADNLTLDASLSTNLVLAEALHGLSSDIVSLVTGSYLQVANSLHGHSAEALTLATASFLTIAEALHTHTADNVTLDTSNATPLTLQDALHAQSADNIALTLDTWLAIVEAVHAQATDNVSLSSEELLSIADALHSHLSDALVLSLPPPPGSCPSAAEIAAAILAAAQITPIYANAKQVNDEQVIGTGATSNKWRSHLVP